MFIYAEDFFSSSYSRYFRNYVFISCFVLTCSCFFVYTYFYQRCTNRLNSLSENTTTDAHGLTMSLEPADKMQRVRVCRMV